MKVIIALVLAIGIAVNSSPIEEKRLIKTSEKHRGSWLTEAEIHVLAKARVNFIDITNDPDFDFKAEPRKTAIPRTPRFSDDVESLIASSNRTRCEDFLREFSAYFNRHSNSETGESSQKWLLGLVEASLEGYQGDYTVSEVNHGRRQQSIIVRMEGNDAQLKSEVVILGGHLDSTAGLGAISASPGADDNGSGSTVILEVLRLISSSQFKPRRTLEFHWYAAEEQGLIGSGQIAQQYSRDNVNVTAMLNLDVVGWHVSGKDYVAIYTDYGDDDLIQFLRELTDTYLEFGWRNNRCGYGCSDHASWDRNGFPAAFAGELEDHPDMHTARDTFDKVNFVQIMEFVKLSLGYVVEISEPME